MFRLCVALSVPHPDHLLELLTHRQLEDWLTFMELEPIGQPADDTRAALIAWSNFQPHSKKSVPLKHFMLNWTGEKETPTPEQYKLKAMAAYARATPREPT